jgi:hypothetical protein
VDCAGNVSPAPDALGFDFPCGNKKAFIECTRRAKYGTYGNFHVYYGFVSNDYILRDFKHKERKFETSRLEAQSISKVLNARYVTCCLHGI